METTLDGPVILYGFPASLYTAKVRSYFIKKGILFEERTPGHPRFAAHVEPGARSSRLPIAEMPDGELVQDSSAIIDYVEARSAGAPLLPPGPVQSMIARLLALFGDEGLLKQAMHYRWSYPENRAFIERDFGLSFATSLEHGAVRDAGAREARRFSSYTDRLGIRPETIPMIDSAYTDLLDALEAHFREVPYLLGGRPCLADFGMLGPLYPHLARDPAPLGMMRERAHMVLRWTEVMNRPGEVFPEHATHPARFPNDDAIPPTLEPVLAIIFEVFGPELVAISQRFAEFVARDPDVPPGRWVSSKGYDQPALGEITFDYRGVRMTEVARVFPLLGLQSILDCYQGLARESRKEADGLIARTGGRALFDITLARRLTRRDNRLAFA